MSKNLVIVESPAKAKTIEKFLGKGYKVTASYGHVRDLPKSEVGVDIENNFEPKYIIPTKARKKVNSLKKEAEKAEALYLATDPDREGEAIAWHILNIVDGKKEAKRVVFSEITENAIKEAFSSPRKIDANLVDAQQGRRVLDRLVGYNLSPLLWKKVRRGLSAGRVQSVAVRLIVERERERKKFKQEEFWNIEVTLSKKDGDTQQFVAKISAQDGKRLEKLAIKNKKQADKIVDDLSEASFFVEKISKKEQKKYPKPPFTTSTLQQAASNVLGFSAKKTMLIAQQLYEGIDLEGSGSVGLITYMRTDSVNLSNQFISAAEDYIKKTYGENYIQLGGRRFKSKVKNAQEAHEAVRPTYADKSPDKISQDLSKDQLKLYKLIYERALASQMTEAKTENTRVEISAKNYGLVASGSRILFDGFMKITKPSTKDQQILPELLEKEELESHKIDPIESHTQPPARYTEAALVKALEENGIGRPSTYAPTMSTIVSRGYVAKENRYFIPQDIGFIVNDLLVEHFSDIVNVEFTAHVEEDLDKIAEGEMNWRNVIREFYEPFSKDLEDKHETIEKHKFPETVTDIKCEKCGKNMVEKFGRYGKFLACSGFPDCKNTKPIKTEIGIPCPKCDGQIVEKRTRKGKTFYGCSNYPKCEFASWYKPTGGKCPQCKSLLIETNKHVKCSSCDFTQNKDE